jgi:hypothetical protein
MSPDALKRLADLRNRVCAMIVGDQPLARVSRRDLEIIAWALGRVTSPKTELPGELDGDGELDDGSSVPCKQCGRPLKPWGADPSPFCADCDGGDP